MQYSVCFTASQGFLESRGRLCWPGLVVLDNSGLIICLLTAELQHQTPLTRANSGSSGSTGQTEGSPGITSTTTLTTFQYHLYHGVLCVRGCSLWLVVVVLSPGEE